MEKHEEQPGSGLKRSLGLLDTVSIEVGAIIGAGIFALTGMAVARCGPAVPILNHSPGYRKKATVLATIKPCACAAYWTRQSGVWNWPSFPGICPASWKV